MAIFKINNIAGKILFLKEKGLSKDKIIKKLSKSYKIKIIKDVLSEIERMALRGFFKRIGFREWFNIEDKIKNNSINSIDLYLSHTCNMACSYCCNNGGSFGVNFKKKMMDWKTAKASLDWFFKQNKGTKNSLTVSFFGGEPLLNKNVFKQCLEYINKKWIGKIDVPLRLMLTTNGTLLDKNILRVISKYKCQLVISLDSSRCEHDKARVFKNSKSTYDVVLNNIKYARKMFPDILISINSTTNHDSNFKDILDQNEVDAYTNMRHRFNIEHSISLYKNKRKIYYDNLKKELKRHYLNRLKDKKSFVYMDSESFGAINSRSSKKMVCGAGISKAAISAGGDIYICALSLFDNKYKIGSVFTKIYGVNSLMDRYKQMRRLHSKDCFKCWAKMNCSGACILEKPGKSAKNRFSLKEGGNFICDIQRLSLEYCIRSYETINREDIKACFNGILISNNGDLNLNIDDKIRLSHLYKDFINKGSKHIKCLNPFYVNE